MGGRFLSVSKKPFGLFRQFSQSAARTHCAPVTHNSHTCSLRCILRQVHAPAQNDSNFIRCFRSELCETFLTVCKNVHPLWVDVFCSVPKLVGFVFLPVEPVPIGVILFSAQ